MPIRSSITAIAAPTPIPAAAPAESPPFELEELELDDSLFEISEDLEDSDADGLEVAAEVPSPVELADRCVALGIVDDCVELVPPPEPAFSLAHISCNLE